MSKRKTDTNGTQFFTKQQFETTRDRIETVEIEIDGETASIRFRRLPFNVGKRYAGIHKDDISEDHLNKMLQVLQDALLDEKGESLFTDAEELGSMPTAVIDKFAIAIFGTGAEKNP